MLAQPKSTITLRRLMDEGAIVICNLSKGGLGEGTAHLLGALLTTAFAQAALSRADTPAAERRPFHLYADEFQSFATESFALILSEARKYALTLTIGHQYLDQIPDDLRAAVFGNVGSIMACRIGATDAPLSPSRSASAGPMPSSIFRTSPPGRGCSAAGAPTSPLRLDLFDAPRPRRQSAHRLIRTSRMRFGRPRAEVEARISKFLEVAVTPRGCGYAYGYAPVVTVSIPRIHRQRTNSRGMINRFQNRTRDFRPRLICYCYVLLFLHAGHAGRVPGR